MSFIFHNIELQKDAHFMKPLLLDFNNKRTLGKKFNCTVTRMLNHFPQRFVKSILYVLKEINRSNILYKFVSLKKS